MKKTPLLLFLTFVTFSWSADSQKALKEKYPVFTKDILFECSEEGYGVKTCKSIPAPFKVEMTNKKIIHKSALTHKDIFLSYISSEPEQEKIGAIYEAAIRKMRVSSSDSSYFTGKIDFRFKISNSGNVDSVTIDSSTTNNNKFDEELRLFLTKWKFKEAKAPTTFTISITFSRTKSSGKEIEEIGIIPGGASPRYGGNL